MVKESRLTIYPGQTLFFPLLAPNWFGVYSKYRFELIANDNMRLSSTSIPQDDQDHFYVHLQNTVALKSMITSFTYYGSEPGEVKAPEGAAMFISSDENIRHITELQREHLIIFRFFSLMLLMVVLLVAFISFWSVFHS